jgi:hypothetical protein
LSDELKSTEKALKTFYWEKNVEEFENIISDSRPEKFKVAVKNDFDALQNAIDSLINKLAETQTELWLAKNLKNPSAPLENGISEKP